MNLRRVFPVRLLSNCCPERSEGSLAISGARKELPCFRSPEKQPAMFCCAQQDSFNERRCRAADAEPRLTLPVSSASVPRFSFLCAEFLQFPCLQPSLSDGFH